MGRWEETHLGQVTQLTQGIFETIGHPAHYIQCREEGGMGKGLELRH